MGAIKDMTIWQYFSNIDVKTRIIVFENGPIIINTRCNIFIHIIVLSTHKLP